LNGWEIIFTGRFLIPMAFPIATLSPMSDVLSSRGEWNPHTEFKLQQLGRTCVLVFRKVVHKTFVALLRVFVSGLSKRGSSAVWDGVSVPHIVHKLNEPLVEVWQLKAYDLIDGFGQVVFNPFFGK